jgi:predicted permease
MRALRRLAAGLAALLRTRRVERDLDEELRAYLDATIDEKVRGGMDEQHAVRVARAEIGSLHAVKDYTRDVGWEAHLENLSQDVRYALRTLRRSRAFTVVAVLTLAVGIGATTAVFSLLDTLRFRTLPVYEPSQLVEITREGGRTVSYPMYELLQHRTEAFSGILLTSAGRFTAGLYARDLQIGDVQLSPVSGNYFAVLGVTPVLGRALIEADVEAANAAVISYRLWQRSFLGDSTILGTTVRLGRRDYTVVGVAPPGFTGVITGHTVDVWVPITWFERTYLQNRVAMMFRLIGRRQPGSSMRQVRASMAVAAAQISNEWRFEQPLRLELADGSGGLSIVRRRFARPLWVLMVIVALLLLIAAVNVAHLLLARAGARQREMAVRLSVGASRSRLIRQLLTESVLLTIAGAALGLLLAPAVSASLVRFVSSAMGSMDLAFDADWRILSFTLATSLVVVVLFGVAPALSATRQDLTGLFKGAPSSPAARIRTSRGGILVAAQVAISCVLLAAAILFSRHMQALATVDLGFKPERVLLMGVGLDAGKAPAGVERVRVYDRLLSRLSRLPGVQSAAFSSEWLFGGGTWTEPVSAPSFRPRPGQDREAVMLVISPRFFDTMRTRLVRGRPFDERDDERSGKVAIVNEAAAHYYVGRTDAVGRMLQVGADAASPQLQIVGVVEDAKYGSVRQPAPRTVYFPALQLPAPIAEANLAIRTSGDPQALADVLWKAARSEVPGLRWRGVTTQASLVESSLAQDRMLAQLSGAIGLTALALVCVGLYGLTAYEVARRTSEIGVRLALGAQRKDVVALVVGRSLIPVVCGLVVGLAAAAALGRLIEGLLFGVRSSDVVTLAAAATIMLAVGAAAASWPARRASMLDPLTTLRAD